MCRADAGFLQWLSAADGSLAVSTYQAGKELFVSAQGDQVGLLQRHFDKPIGMGFDVLHLPWVTYYTGCPQADKPACRSSPPAARSF